jgi:hypothetical protein
MSVRCRNAGRIASGCTYFRKKLPASILILGSIEFNASDTIASKLEVCRRQVRVRRASKVLSGSGAALRRNSMVSAGLVGSCDGYAA